MVDKPILKLFDSLVSHGKHDFIEPIHVDLIVFKTVHHSVEISRTEEIMSVII